MTVMREIEMVKDSRRLVLHAICEDGLGYEKDGEKEPL